MTAYGAANSLRNTIDYILHSSHFSLVGLAPSILQDDVNKLESLQKFVASHDFSLILQDHVDKLESLQKFLDFHDFSLILQDRVDKLESLQKFLASHDFSLILQDHVDKLESLQKIQERLDWIRKSKGILQDANHELESLQKILERLDSTSTSKSRKKVNGLDGRIKELIWEFQDLLETLLYQQILPQLRADHLYEEMTEKQAITASVWSSTEPRSKPVEVGLLTSGLSQPQFLSEVGLRESDSHEKFSIDLKFLQHHVYSFIQRLEEMEKEYIYEVDNMPEDDDEDESISTRSGTKSKMVGLSDQFQHLKREFMGSDGSYNYIALVGTAGVGKTALAEAVFEDSEILSRFEHRVWVTVGRKSQYDGVWQVIQARLCGITHLEEGLKGEKCLIVLDDVWERQTLDSLISSLLKKFGRSIHILVTTRDRNVTFSKMDCPTSTIVVRFLNEEESKELLCEKVFREKDCPFKLDKAVTKIAKICEGLPLTIVTVADILSKAQNTDPKYWDDVAEMRNSVFTDAYDEISKVLFPSYEYLPQYLKMTFLYLGVFPPDYDIPLSKLMNMLDTESWFRNTIKKQPLNDSVWVCLNELCIYRSLALSKRRSIFSFLLSFPYREFKTCRLHSSWRYVCRGEARKNKFYYVLKKLVDGLEDGVKGQHCLCLENNLLFSIKEFCSYVRLNCASSTRSLFFFGPYHKYPIPIGDDFKLLGKLDALKLRLYTFPSEILALVLLKYLALTCNGELPPTISKLFNLRVLIIHPHSNIRICRAPSYVPIQIWDMQELEHIEILGRNLVAPYRSTSLKKLSTLVGVNANICTISELFRKVPWISKLAVQIELMPYDDQNDFLSCFGCISTLGSLRILKFSILNPMVKYDYACRSSLMMFPSGLKKLHLSGMGFPWEHIDVIGSLPFLEVLKLRAYAFRGSKWEAQEGSFLELKFLLIEDSDLVQWKPRLGSFPNLMYLSMKHCYKLEEIHWLSDYPSGTIELVNCNPVALACAKQLQPSSDTRVDVIASFSFDADKPTTVKFTRPEA